MKKTSTIVKEKNKYEIGVIINNTAYIKSVTGKTGLLNIKTNQIVGEMDNYYTIYNVNEKLYYQEKTIEERDEENNCNLKHTIRIYDALNEKTLVDGWEIVNNSAYYDLIIVKSPIDGKLHLFDCHAFRKSTNIFDLPLDNIKYIYRDYRHSHNLILPIEFENIEGHNEIIIYTKNNKKYFEYFDKIDDKIYNKVSTGFDEITVDEKNTNIVYCKKENKTYVYDILNRKLLFSTDSDEIKFMYRDDSEFNNFYENFLFEIVKNRKHGVISSKFNKGIRETGTCAKVSTLLAPQYDEIERHCDGILYLKKTDKIGLFVGSSYQNQIIEPKYDKIDNLGSNYFALYTNGLCDVGKVVSYIPFTPSITNCEIAKKFGCILSYKKNGKYGLLIEEDKIVSPEYDNISEVTRKCYILEKNNKK